MKGAPWSPEAVGEEEQGRPGSGEALFRPALWPVLIPDWFSLCFLTLKRKDILCS